MFTNVKFEIAPNAIDNSNDIVELDMDMLNCIGGGDAISSPFIGGSK
jgi:hypothetical protein